MKIYQILIRKKKTKKTKIIIKNNLLLNKLIKRHC